MDGEDRVYLATVICWLIFFFHFCSVIMVFFGCCWLFCDFVYVSTRLLILGVILVFIAYVRWLVHRQQFTFICENVHIR